VLYSMSTVCIIVQDSLGLQSKAFRKKIDHLNDFIRRKNIEDPLAVGSTAPLSPLFSLLSSSLSLSCHFSFSILPPPPSPLASPQKGVVATIPNLCSFFFKQIVLLVVALLSDGSHTLLRTLAEQRSFLRRPGRAVQLESTLNVPTLSALDAII